MIIKYVTFFIGLTFLTHSWSGNEGGNGGDAIVCRNSKHEILSAELFDYYEARVLREIELFFPTEPSAESAFRTLSKRLSAISPKRAEKYDGWARRFLDEIVWIEADLEDIPDSGPVIFPTGCKLEQVAIQFTAPLPGQKRFLINSAIWKALPVSHRAGLMMHEFLYREAIVEHGHSNSILVRYFNSTIASLEEMQKLRTQEDIFNFIRFTSFKVAEAFSQELCAKCRSTFDPQTGEILSGVLWRNEIELREQKLAVSSQDISFYPGGQVRSCSILDPYIDPTTGMSFKGTLSFYPNGKIAQGTATADSIFIEPNSGVRFQGNFSFYESGRIEWAHLVDQDLSLGNLKLFFKHPSSLRVSFDESGRPAYIEYANFVPERSHLVMGGVTVNIMPGRSMGIVFKNGIAVSGLRTSAQVDSFIPVQGKLVRAKRETDLELTSYGGIKAFIPDDEAERVDLEVGKKTVSFIAAPFSTYSTLQDAFLRFYDLPGDVVYQGYLLGNQSLPNESGKEEMFKNQTCVQFSQEGLVTK